MSAEVLKGARASLYRSGKRRTVGPRWTPVNLFIHQAASVYGAPPTDLNGVDLLPERVEPTQGAQLERLPQRPEVPGPRGRTLGS